MCDVFVQPTESSTSKGTSMKFKKHKERKQKIVQEFEPDLHVVLIIRFGYDEATNKNFYSIKIFGVRDGAILAMPRPMLSSLRV
ncbi:hypothetical protein OROMI_022678 [Orobanche minor]